MGAGLSDRTSAASSLRLSTVWIWAALLVPATLAFGTISSVDLAYLIRAGDIMLDTGRILRVDVLTFSARCDAWINQQWGAEIVVAGAFGLSGWFGLALLRAALAVGVAGFVYAACRGYGAGRRVAAWLTLGAGVVLLGGFQLRAQLFGLLSFAALRWILAGRREHPRRMGFAVPVVLGWANLHGSFPLGIVLLVLAWIEDRVDGRDGRRTLAVAAIASVATLVTPFGPAVWTYVLDLSTDPMIRDVVREWRPPGLDTYTGVMFFVSTLAAIVALVPSGRTLRWPAWIELGLFLALAASSSRNVFWWVIVLVTTVARVPFARREPTADPRSLLNAVMIGVLAVVTLVAAGRWLPYTSSRAPDLVRHAPIDITARLRTLLARGEPFANSQSWGSWFELALPGHPVWIDSRFEVVPTEVVRASVTVAETRPGWEREVASLPVRVFVVDRATQPALADAIRSLDGWRAVYTDADGLIVVREKAPPVPATPSCSRGLSSDVGNMA